ncbi:unnamed protein product, partial [Coregonus sp. 'balchen']
MGTAPPSGKPFILSALAAESTSLNGSWLEDLLKGEFQPLSRLLLLLGWTQCQSLLSAQTLLRLLHYDQALANDSVLREFADGLSSQLGYDERLVLDLLNTQPKPTGAGCPPLFQLYLSECQIYLEAVPAMFRLELLENIFSLLFLSNADFTLHNHQGATTSTGQTDQTEHSEEKEEKRRKGEEEGKNRRDGQEENKSSTKVGGTGEEDHHQPHNLPFSAAQRSHLDLGHLTAGCRGFLVDLGAMKGFLRLLRESLEGVVVVGQLAGLEEDRALAGEAEVAESLGCSVTAETFEARLQRLSKRTAEAQWRLQIITSNQDSGNVSDHPHQLQASPAASPASCLKRRSSSTGVRRRKKPRRHHSDRLPSTEIHNGEVSTSPSGKRPSGKQPPQVNGPSGKQAPQVSLMFGLEGSSCCGELVFMERYRDGPGGAGSRGAEDRDTLLIFILLLLRVPGSGRGSQPGAESARKDRLLDRRSQPPAMAAFDLGLRVEPKVKHSEGIRGFPAVLQQISKILSHTSSHSGNKGPTKTETAVEDNALSSPLGCCIQEVLLCCHPVLSEEGIATRLSLAQHLEITLQTCPPLQTPRVSYRPCPLLQHHRLVQTVHRLQTPPGQLQTCPRYRLPTSVTDRPPLQTPQVSYDPVHATRHQRSLTDPVHPTDTTVLTDPVHRYRHHRSLTDPTATDPQVSTDPVHCYRPTGLLQTQSTDRHHRSVTDPVHRYRQHHRSVTDLSTATDTRVSYRPCPPLQNHRSVQTCHVGHHRSVTDALSTSTDTQVSTDRPQLQQTPQVSTDPVTTAYLQPGQFRPCPPLQGTTGQLQTLSTATDHHRSVTDPVHRYRTPQVQLRTLSTATDTTGQLQTLSTATDTTGQLQTLSTATDTTGQLQTLSTATDTTGQLQTLSTAKQDTKVSYRPCPPLQTHRSVTDPVHRYRHHRSVTDPVHRYRHHRLVTDPVHRYRHHRSVTDPVHRYRTPQVSTDPVHRYRTPQVSYRPCPPYTDTTGQLQTLSTATDTTGQLQTLSTATDTTRLVQTSRPHHRYRPCPPLRHHRSVTDPVHRYRHTQSVVTAPCPPASTTPQVSTDPVHATDTQVSYRPVHRYRHPGQLQTLSKRYRPQVSYRPVSTATDTRSVTAVHRYRHHRTTGQLQTLSTVDTTGQLQTLATATDHRHHRSVTDPVHRYRHPRSVTDPGQVSTTVEGRAGGALLAALVEQASLKQSELESHPVRSSMKQLLRSLDQLCPLEPQGAPCRPDYMRSFVDYAPSQLLSHLLFDRQVAPDRVLSLLQQEGLRLSVQQVIVQRCCEALPVWDWCPEPKREASLGREAGPGGEAGQGQGQTVPGEGVFRTASLAALLQLHTQEHMPTLGITEPQSDPASSESEASLEDLRATTPPVLILSSSSLSPSRPASSSSSSSFLLTPSALSFLKSRSPLLATLACLSASPRGAARVQPSGWLVFRGGGRKECVLDGEQISREGDSLLRDFPILRAYLGAMVQPVLGTSLGAGEEGAGGGGAGGLGAALCGKPLVSLLLSGPQGTPAQAVAMEAFQQALASRDLGRALSLLELYGQGSSQEGDPCLRARVALQVLERWPLGSSLELLEFCLNNPHMEASLRGELELMKRELDIYQRMLNLQPALPWEFSLCAEWVVLYSVSDHLRLQLQTEHLLHLLEKGQTDNAFQLLEGLSDLTLGLEVCERALDRRPGLAACHFLANYLTLHFQSQVLLTLPPSARQDYFPLLSEPLLMLEQLLMNLKVDWADLADDQCPAQDSCPSTPSRMETPPLTAGSTPLHTSSSSSSLDRGSTSRRIQRSPAQFQPPDSAPVRKDWVPDTQQHVCMFNRRHHCRRCGRLVCHACSGHKMAVEGCTEEEKEVRVCDQCYIYFHPDSDDELEHAEVAGGPVSTEGVFRWDASPARGHSPSAPSASLCVAILSLHSDQTACGHQLIGHCRSLSRKLTNPEVDARLLTDVMRQLLFSAKLMFVKTAALTRLRNQLLEAEYYQLAVEVSTKSGLDPGGVWQAWGMASLKAGNLTVAREKLSRCLKAPVDRNQLNLGPRLLQEIISHLESTVRPTLVMGSNLYQESLYYLSSYGTHLALVSFLMRHDNMKDALQHLLSKECPEEVFLEGVLQPSLERGRLGVLQGLLETLDPGLEVCSRYLLSSCQLLQRRGHFHTLYQLQQFMMDHVRAAMTCIRFFTHGVVSYAQLGDQRRWLVRAKEHLRTYLQEQQGARTRKRSTTNSFRKKMASSDVSRHMNTIELQLEVMLGGKNIEEGFGIAYRVIQDFQLEALAVYVRAGRRLVRQRQFKAVRQLLKCVGESGTATKNDCDVIILSCVSIADKGPTDAKELESLILETKNTENKIKAYLQVSKLRAAYLLAVKLDTARAGPLVQEVLQAAEGVGDSVMQDICC